MGVGKGHALRWMSDTGYLPLDGIVCIDPDHFKSSQLGARSNPLLVLFRCAPR